MDEEKIYKSGDTFYKIKDSEVKDFLKDIPDALECETFKVGEQSYAIPEKDREDFLKDNPHAVSLKKKEETTFNPFNFHRDLVSEVFGKEAEKPSEDTGTQPSPSVSTPSEQVSLEKPSLTITPPKETISLGVTPETRTQEYLTGKEIERAEPKKRYTAKEYITQIPRSANREIAAAIRYIGELGTAARDVHTQEVTNKILEDTGLNPKTEKAKAITLFIAESLKQSVPTMPGSDALKQLADAIDSTQQGFRDVDTGTGQILQGFGSLLGDIATLYPAQSAKVAKLAQYGMQDILKWPSLLAIKEGTAKAQEGGTTGEVLLGTAKGVVQGLTYDAIGITAGRAGKLVEELGAGKGLKEAAKATVTKEGAETAVKGGIQALSSGTKALVNGTLFGLDSVAEGGTFQQGFGMGLAFGIPEIAGIGLKSVKEAIDKSITTRAWTSYVTATDKNIRTISALRVDPFDLREQSDALWARREKETDPVVKEELLKEKNAIDNIININAVTKTILQNPQQVIDQIKNSNIKEETKTVLVDKINKTISQADPRIINSAPIVTKIEELKNEAKTWETMDAPQEVKEAKLADIDVKIKEQRKLLNDELNRDLTEVKPLKTTEVKGEQENASRIRTETETRGGEETQGVEQGTQSILRLRDVEKKRMEGKLGEEVITEQPKGTTTGQPKEEKAKFPEGYTAEVQIKPVKGQGITQDKVVVTDDATGQVASRMNLKTKAVNGEVYWEGGSLYTSEEHANKGLAQNVFKKAMDSLPEEYKGLYFPEDTILNDKQIPHIFEKLKSDYDVTTNEKGDVFITPKKEITPEEEPVAISTEKEVVPQKTAPLETEVEPKEVVTEEPAKQPVSEVKTEEKPTTPPEPPTPPIKGEGKKVTQPEKENEKALLNRMHKAEGLSEEFKKKIEDKGLTYQTVPNNVTSREVDYLIADNGLDESEKIVYSSSDKVEPRVKALTAVRLVKAFDELAEGAKYVYGEDSQEEYNYRMRAVNLADHVDQAARSWGRGIQMLASAEVQATMAPKTEVLKAKTFARGQRDTQIKENKKEITKKQKSMEEANKQSIEEALKSKIFEKLSKETANKVKRTIQRDISVTKEKIAQEKKYRKGQWDAFNKAKTSGSVSISAVGFNKEQIEAIGNIVGSYVREGYYRTEVLAAKLIKDLKQHSNIDLTEEEAIKLIPKEVEGKSLEELQQIGKTAEASTKLAARINRMLEDPKIPKDDPVKQMVETLFQKVSEKDIKEKQKLPKKPTIEKIKEAIENKKDYASTWEETKNLIKEKIKNNAELSEEQKADYNKRLESFYQEVIGKPYGEKQVKEIVKGKMEEMGTSIEKVVKDHYTVYDATKRTLQEKLIDELSLSGEDAKLLADAISKEFDKIATEKKRAILKRGITAKEVVHPKTAKLLHDKLIELTNLGAFSEGEFAEAYADKWGFPKLEAAQVKEIERLAKAVQNAPEGYKKFERIQDLLSYQENLKGIDMGEVGMSLWYSSILSGYRTQGKNFLQNTITSLFELGIAMGRHPEYTPRLVEGLIKGWGEGLLEAQRIMKTGYNPIKGYKIEVPSVQERIAFKGGKLNPATWAKVFPRLMVAADAFSYGGLKEMRSYEIAMNEARKINKNATEPTMSNWAKATELLNKTSEKVKLANEQASLEGLTGNEKKRRVWELMEQGRTKEMVEDAAHFAAHGTFNYQPEGVLGMFTELVSRGTQGLALRPKIPFTERHITVRPAKFIIPFTRIIANVTNMALDYYPPVGLARAGFGQVGAKGFETTFMGKGFYRKYTPEEKQKVFLKAMIGLAAQAAVLALTEPDDKGESAWEISANGYGDYAKNKELEKTGWQPYSIKINGKWESYQYTPLVLALAPIGAFRDMQKYSKESVSDKTLTDMIALSAWKGIRVINDMTWAASLNNLMSAMNEKTPDKAESQLKNLTTSTAKGFIYPKIAEQTVQLYDAVMENPRHESSTLMGRIFRDIPIVRNKYNVMLNAVGEPVKYDAFPMFGKQKEDPFWDYMAKTNATIGKPRQNVPIYDDVNNIERGMTDQEYFDFVRISGAEIKRRIEEEVMGKGLPEKDAINEINNIKNEERKRTQQEMFGWGNIRMNNPEDWQLIKNNGAVRVTPSYVDVVLLINGKDKKVRLNPEQLKEYNNIAMEEYRKGIVPYLKNKNTVQRDKETIDPKQGISDFYLRTDEDWAYARKVAKDLMEEKLQRIENNK